MTELKPWMVPWMKYRGLCTEEEIPDHERLPVGFLDTPPEELDQLVAAAIESTLATPEPEPVGWICRLRPDVEWVWTKSPDDLPAIYEVRKVYLSPPAPTLHERDEDGNWICCCGDSLPTLGAMEGSTVAVLPINPDTGAVGPVTQEMVDWAGNPRDGGVFALTDRSIR